MARFLKHLCLFLLAAAAAVAQPTITTLSNTTGERSSRLLITGSGFGVIRGTGHVAISGITAPVTRWSDTMIAAYIPETAPVGTLNVQVFASQGLSSNLMPLDVTMRGSQGDHIRWRFQADADYIQSRPAVASDGTVYTIDVYGHLYAISPTGGLKWVFNVPGTGFGEVSVGADGTIYTGNTTVIVALSPSGSLRWQYNQNPGANTLFGPNLGPDGNLYAVGFSGLGVFSLTPQGVLRWSTPEDITKIRAFFPEIVFGAPWQSQLYFHGNSHLRSVALDGTQLFSYADVLGNSQADSQPAVAADGSVYSNLFVATGPGILLGKFDNQGNRLWAIFDKFANPTTMLTTPEVGPDGVVYDGRNLMSLYAINPDSTVRWQYTDAGILFSHMVSPLNDLIFAGGAVNYGEPGFFEAISTTGKSLWKTVLPLANGLNIVPMSRARFTPDGQTVYIGTSIPGQSSDGFSYIYSVQTGTNASTNASLASLTLTPTSVVGSKSATATITFSAPAPIGGAVVTLVTTNPTVVILPATVTVSAGSLTRSYAVKTAPVTTVIAVPLTASYGGSSVSATLTVKPPSISAVSLLPNSVKGGASSQGTVKLNGPAPAGGVRINLASGNTAVATVPASVTVVAGVSSANFTVHTKAVGANIAVTISAVGGGVTRKTNLTVTP